jgi:hypothetical protein
MKLNQIIFATTYLLGLTLAVPVPLSSRDLVGLPDISLPDITLPDVSLANGNDVLSNNLNGNTISNNGNGKSNLGSCGDITLNMLVLQPGDAASALEGAFSGNGNGKHVVQARLNHLTDSLERS